MKSKYQVILDSYRSLSNRLIGQRVVFHHVPKCGGTSLNRALRLRYFISQRSIMANPSIHALVASNKSLENNPAELNKEVRSFRKKMLYYYLYVDTACVTGHVNFCQHTFRDFSSRYKFMTVLRHPTERFISNYIWLSQQQRSYYKTDLSLSEYIDSEDAVIQSKTLCEYFSGSESLSIDYCQTDIENAKKNLGNLDLVGFTDKMELFNLQLNELLGINIRIGHENKSTTPKSKTNKLVTPAIQKRIEKLCQGDIEIYNHARKTALNSD